MFLSYDFVCSQVPVTDFYSRSAGHLSMVMYVVTV